YQCNDQGYSQKISENGTCSMEEAQCFDNLEADPQECTVLKKYCQSAYQSGTPVFTQDNENNLLRMTCQTEISSGQPEVPIVFCPEGSVPVSYPDSNNEIDYCDFQGDTPAFQAAKQSSFENDGGQYVSCDEYGIERCNDH